VDFYLGSFWVEDSDSGMVDSSFGVSTGGAISGLLSVATGFLIQIRDLILNLRSYLTEKLFGSFLLVGRRCNLLLQLLPIT
jgi:hypothetical protein